MNKKILASLIINILIFTATAAVTVSYYFYSNNPFVATGLDSYMFFTTDSNILAAIASAVLIPFEVQILRGKRERLPHFAVVFKYIGMTAVMLTFTTVMTLLLPQYDAGFLLLGTAFYMHLAGPLMALVSFVFLETDSKIKLPETLLALIPSLLYGIVYLTQVVIIGEENGGWADFYTFNKGGCWFITMPISLLVTYLIAVLTRLAHNKLTTGNTGKKNKAEQAESKTISVTVINEVIEADIWVLPQTEKNLKSSLWGTATISKLKAGDNKTVALSSVDDNEKYIVRIIDADKAYYSASDMVLGDGYTIRFKTGNTKFDSEIVSLDQNGTILLSKAAFQGVLGAK